MESQTPQTFIVNNFGVSRMDDELRIEASAETLARQQHNLIQAMLAINDQCIAIVSDAP